MESAFSLETLILVLILACYVCTAKYIQDRRVPYLHETVVAIVLGALTSILILVVFKQRISFNDVIFFNFILPPIIFAAGYSLRKSLFFQNFGIISFFGILGTIFTFIVLSACITFINNLLFGKLLNLSEVLLLSSVLCATDTVTALSLIKQEQSPALSSILFGQGILNDAVAIIIFRSVRTIILEDKTQIGAIEVLVISLQFLYLMISSIALGLLFGFGLAYILKNNPSLSKEPLKQSSLILLTAYACYLSGQMVDLSGIISLFTCSIIMGHYCFKNLSAESRHGTVVAFDAVGYLAQAFVFAYLGICILTITGQWKAILMGLLIIVMLPLSRAVPVYILPLLYVIAQKKFPMTSSQTNICWLAGLIRGAIAFALSLQIQSTNSEFIKTVTLVVVLLTTISGSVYLKSKMDYFQQGLVNTQSTSDRPISTAQITDEMQKEQGLAEPNQKKAQKQTIVPKKQTIWSRFENRYILPVFTRPQDQQPERQNGNQRKSAPTAISDMKLRAFPEL